MLLVEIAQGNDIARSFASLVKHNNGFFKSEKQARFLLSRCDEDNTYTTGGSVYGNSYNIFYKCDEKGVIEVVKSTTSGPDKTTWKRKSKEESAASPEYATKIRDLDRSMKMYQGFVDAAKAEIEKLEGHRSEWPEGAMNMFDQMMKDAVEKRDDHTENVKKHMKWIQDLQDKMDHKFKTM